MSPPKIKTLFRDSLIYDANEKKRRYLIAGKVGSFAKTDFYQRS